VFRQAVSPFKHATSRKSGRGASAPADPRDLRRARPSPARGRLQVSFRMLSYQKSGSCAPGPPRAATRRLSSHGRPRRARFETDRRPYRVAGRSHPPRPSPRRSDAHLASLGTNACRIRVWQSRLHQCSQVTLFEPPSRAPPSRQDQFSIRSIRTIAQVSSRSGGASSCPTGWASAPPADLAGGRLRATRRSVEADLTSRARLFPPETKRATCRLLCSDLASDAARRKRDSWRLEHGHRSCGPCAHGIGARHGPAPIAARADLRSHRDGIERAAASCALSGKDECGSSNSRGAALADLAFVNAECRARRPPRAARPPPAFSYRSHHQARSRPLNAPAGATA